MAAEKRSSHSGTALKRRHKFNPKRGPRPQVLANANRTVVWAASLVVVAFFVIVTVNALLF
ncbi:MULTISPECIES: hypothetical protein [Rhizobium]|uniref:Uncharacterized protein n=1 Tax=Rhizobium favelukesii TaxID=348824 RepID=W6RU89_9HYPH|nr:MULTISPECIES: hypothetical protein [Rhizobium]MCA0802130.1 hypothetical protein [Rhizobium sp. T1473]MCS0458758.1 hypothetical protein [Rhizobium favelukesii]UFS80685.1 hypothetical protein LPB79_20155 [Rhizobium sp. T136]CDM57871.1 hypothetical protein LPU83_2214 [Rhizobium favelukesii]